MKTHPCTTRCFRVGAPISIEPGGRCPECGMPWPVQLTNLFDYRRSLQLKRESFQALLLATMSRADSDHSLILRRAFPIIWRELQERHNSPGGRLEDDDL